MMFDLFLSGCCALKPAKTVSLEQAIGEVHKAIVALQTTNKDTGMILSETHVTLALAAREEGDAIGVVLPVESRASGPACKQATAADQIDFTFQNYLTIPSASVAGTFYSAKIKNHESKVETDVTDSATNTVVRTATIDSGATAIQDLADFLKELSRSGGYVPNLEQH
jgi:hypothetical protein